MGNKEEHFYLVRSDVLPEAMKKTIEAKALLEEGSVSSIFEAVQRVDLSRSAFYKYRDAVYPFQEMVKEHMITLFFHLEDRKGSLSNLLGTVSKAGCNVLTIHQTIPLQGKANVTLSLNTAGSSITIDELISKLQKVDFINRVELLSTGA
ncbi:ACT domain-containing protein [Thalassobacillus pellis]|uniref:ACT domain-containing protein n=1 Tax=Thalassobacillus pellis TaxID=748008 RepID=UPI0019613F6D|nr:ACT domain-containing protein [Thalassobacillus pellis]MBM7554630.1 chorismate mutase [Thalassobacillus pellis]